MLKTVQSVLGHRKLVGMVPLTIKSSNSQRGLTAKINKTIKKFDNCSGVLILSELVGSTQSNICKDFISKGNVEMICGYNLPMLIKAAMANQKHSLAWLKKQVLEDGKKYLKGIH